MISKTHSNLTISRSLPRDARLAKARPHFRLGSKTPAASTSAPPRALTGERFLRPIVRLERQRHEVDKLIAAAERGQVFDAGALIALQVRVYRYAHDLELYSRILDKATSATKTLLQQQV